MTMIDDLLVTLKNPHKKGHNILLPAQNSRAKQHEIKQDLLRTWEDSANIVLNGSRFLFGDLDNSDIKRMTTKAGPMFNLQELRLPFPMCSFAYSVFASDMGKVDFVTLAVSDPEDDQGMIQLTEFQRAKTVNTTKNTWVWTGVIGELTPQTLEPTKWHSKVVASVHNDSMREREASREANEGLGACLAFLNLPGIRTNSVAGAKHAVNTQRLRTGKKALLDHTVVFFGDVKRSKTGTLPTPRSSPRAHLRRGHARHLKDGRVIWIHPTKVGNPANGTVDQQTYKLRKP